MSEFSEKRGASSCRRSSCRRSPALSVTFLFPLFSLPSFSLRVSSLAKMGREEEDYPGACLHCRGESSAYRASQREKKSLKERESKVDVFRSSSTFFAVSRCRFFESRRRSTALSRPLFVPLACFSSLRTCALCIGEKDRAFLGPRRGEQRSTRRKVSENHRRERKHRVGKVKLSRLRLLFFSAPRPSIKIPTNQQTRWRSTS